MTTVYRCDVCYREFDSAQGCRNHERTHFDGNNQIKYDLLNSDVNNICDYCQHSYYVYGCERDCSHKNCSRVNFYCEFEPVEPLHNKTHCGGV